MKFFLEGGRTIPIKKNFRKATISDLQEIKKI